MNSLNLERQLLSNGTRYLELQMMKLIFYQLMRYVWTNNVRKCMKQLFNFTAYIPGNF